MKNLADSVMSPMSSEARKIILSFRFISNLNYYEAGLCHFFSIKDLSEKIENYFL